MTSSSPTSAPARTTFNPPKTPRTYTYPYASSPDIIRSNQKDTHLQSHLHTHLTSILRQLYGTRFAHKYDTEARTLTDLLYLSLTTLIGNRTLGEEYCDIHQIEARTQKLPTINRRAGYILTVVLLPYTLSKFLPPLRTRLRLHLSTSLTRLPKTSLKYRLQAYILTHLSTITSISTSPLYALSLSIFYFSGSYYHLSKRLFGLRYIFSKQLPPAEAEQRGGYEVLGVLLVLQMAVQTYLHIKDTVSADIPTEGASAMLDDGVEIGLSNNNQTPQSPNPSISQTNSSYLHISATAHIPLTRYDLSDPTILAWLQPAQQRKCTLCLEPMKDPSVTTCGHVFCWTCIRDWVEEKPECPLCRQGVLGQHVLPLRG